MAKTRRHSNSAQRHLLRHAGIVLGMSLTAAACSSTDDNNDSSDNAAAESAERIDQSEERIDQSEECASTPTEPIDASTDTVELSNLVFKCAEFAVVVPENASQVNLKEGIARALAVEGPLLVETEENAAEIGDEIKRLGAKRVNVGQPYLTQGIRVGWSDISPPERFNTKADSSDLSNITNLLEASTSDGAPFVMTESEDTSQQGKIPALAAAGFKVSLVNPEDPEALHELGRTIGAETPVSFGQDLSETQQWAIAVGQSGNEVPGGGIRVFPDRRIIALYGNPETSALGLLGEQDPAGSVERLKPLLKEFATDDGVPLVGGFEIIATVASAGAGDDGDYSSETSIDTLRPLVDAAGEAGYFVILDLQPGRTSFLAQAKIYEELLSLPHVGLGLDPEWRIGPNERHLAKIGSVDAEEVNQVVDYLAQLVREKALPQKVLVLHQFQVQMLRDRETIKTPDELAVVVHADGQGGQEAKASTWQTLLDEPQGPDQTLWWGWKNFVDEDIPMATPAQTNEIEPLPVVVTYQ